MPNYRSECAYCKKEVLNRDIGNHIVKQHADQLFTAENRKLGLHKDKYLSRPMELFVGDKTYHFCFADNSCIKNASVADDHFKRRADQHRDAVLALREKYPLAEGDSVVQSVAAAPTLSVAERKTLQEFMIQVVRVDQFAFTRKEKAVFGKLGIIVEVEELKKLFPQSFPQYEDDEEQEEQEESEDVKSSAEQAEETKSEALHVFEKVIDPCPVPAFKPSGLISKPSPQDLVTRQVSNVPSLKIIQSTKKI